MVIEICLIIISIMLTVLVAALIVAAIKMNQSVDRLETNLDQVCNKTTHLVDNLSGLSEDIREKAKALDFISYPLKLFCHKKQESVSPDDEKNGKETFLQVVKWVALSVSLIKLTKELKNGK